jgi:hypothetical protein
MKDEEVDAFVASVAMVIADKYGDGNTYRLEKWVGLTMTFTNDEGHTITIDEKTLEINEA